MLTYCLNDFDMVPGALPIMGLLLLLLLQSQGPRSLRRSLRRLSRVVGSILPGAWMFVCCECWVLSVTDLYDELITRPEEIYRLWCVVVCDLEISKMKRPWPALGRKATEGEKIIVTHLSPFETSSGTTCTQVVV